MQYDVTQESGVLTAAGLDVLPGVEVGLGQHAERVGAAETE